MEIAQTNLQLYNQLRSADWADSELRSVRQSYDLAQKLFASAYRPSQKPFVCHLADLYDELLDLGPIYAPAKVPKELRGEVGVDSEAVISAASQVISNEVGLVFKEAIQNIDQASVPDFLTTADMGSKRIKESIPKILKRKRAILGRWLR